MSSIKQCCDAILDVNMFDSKYDVYQLLLKNIVKGCSVISYYPLHTVIISNDITRLSETIVEILSLINKVNIDKREIKSQTISRICFSVEISNISKNFSVISIVPPNFFNMTSARKTRLNTTIFDLSNKEFLEFDKKIFTQVIQPMRAISLDKNSVINKLIWVRN